MPGYMFNIDGGYLEGLCRGFKCGILKQADYLNLVQCETLEGESLQPFPILERKEKKKKTSFQPVSHEIAEDRNGRLVGFAEGGEG